MVNLFQRGEFKSAAGLPLPWKIECDALTDEDWACIALAGSKMLPMFSFVDGVPTGGMKLAAAINPYRKGLFAPILYVDDVWTMGKSMNHAARGLIAGVDWIGYVAFARGPLPTHVRCFMRVEG